jgi:hypothetical protein
MKKITTYQKKIEDIVEWDLGHRRWILKMRKKFQDPEFYYRKLIALCKEHDVLLNWDNAIEFHTIRRNSITEKILCFKDAPFPASLSSRFFQTGVERMFHPMYGMNFFNVVKCEEPVILNDGFIVIRS